VSFINVHTSKKAELFYKALEDLWAAEQIWFGSPNIAVWNCSQAIEKTMKGFLRCVSIDHDHSHQLRSLLEDVESVFHPTEESKKYILLLDDYGTSLRYKNMANDPSPEDAKLAITRTKQIMHEFNANPKISQFMDEAREVHTKILEANLEKYRKM
jgi:HEPN domain-containing protein